MKRRTTGFAGHPIFAVYGKFNHSLTICPGIAAPFQSRRPSPDPRTPAFRLIFASIVIRVGLLEDTVQYLETSGQQRATAGFTPRRRGDRALIRRTGLMVQAIATVGLILSLAVAATAVSIGIARAQACAPISPAHISVTVAQ
jgi:hypothetical protein